MKITKLNECKTTDTVTDDLNEQVTTPLTEDDSGDGVIKDDGATIEVAVDIKDDGTPTTKTDSLKIKNALTDILDRALDDAKYALAEENFDANCNVLVEGLPGSSKTATIRNWCKANGCNLYYLDAKNPDLQLLTSGASAIDKTDPSRPKVNTAFSNALAKLDRPNSVLFLDELNRQIREYMRGSLLTLLADRRVAGEDEEGFRYFPNLLFTVAAINPTVDGDKGATELNSAERRRFYYGVEFHSEVATTQVFFKEYYDKKIVDYVTKLKGAALTPVDIERINSFCLRQWIGIKIILDEDFHYTTVDEYKAATEKGRLLCQSMITEMIDHSRGDLKRLEQDINASRNLTESAKEMLIKIIRKLVLPNIDALRAKKASELGLDLGKVAAADISVEADTEDEDDDMPTPEDFLSGKEDDADYYDDGAGVAAASVDSDKLKAARASDAAIASRLADFASTW